MSPQRAHRQKSLSSSSYESSTSTSTYDSFFSTEDSNIMEKQDDAASTSSSSSASSIVSNHNRLSRRRIQRNRAVTLLPGSIYHEVFFSSDDSIRDNFDEQAEYAKCARNRNLSFTRNDRRSSNMFDGAVKSGRPLLPRYGTF